MAPNVEDLLEQARDLEESDIGRARSLVQQARVLARAEHKPVAEAEALYRLAELSYASGLTNEAFAVALEARDLAHRCGAPKIEVAALNLIAAVQYHASNFSEALASALAALDLYRTLGERSSEGLLLNSLAVIQHSLRDTDKAIVTYEAALMANKGEDRPDLDAITLANMAKVRADRKEDLLAVSLGESALELARDHAAEFTPEILARLAMAYVSLNALDRAEERLAEAEHVLRDRTDRHVPLSPGSAVTTEIAFGELFVAQGRHEEALARWSEALDLATRAGMSEVALDLREKLAHLNRDLGRFEAALAHQEARYALNEEMFNRGTDLRIKTLQIQHDTEAARQQAEILRLRTGELESLVAQRTDVYEAFVCAAFERMADVLDTNGGYLRSAEAAHELALQRGVAADEAERIRWIARVQVLGLDVLADSPSVMVQRAAEVARGDLDCVAGSIIAEAAGAAQSKPA